MSSVVTAPRRTVLRSGQVADHLYVRGHAVSADLLTGVAVSAFLLLLAFVAQGGVSLTPNTWTQAALLLIGAAVAVAVIVLSPAGAVWGAGTLALFGALAALTYASIAWSVQPANSWLEANRTLSYLAIFGAAVGLARLAPGRWRGVVGGLAAAAVISCGYALLVKVFPSALDPGDPLGRLRAPFDYWGATGLMAAIGIPACLWAGARREAAPVLRALCVPGIAILVPALLLSYSRGSLIVAIAGTACWFALVPLRLRAALLLILGALGGAAIAAWAFATHSISADGVASSARASAGHAFGLVIVVVLALTLLAGVGASFAADRFALAPSNRRRIGRVLLGVAALLPVGGVVALAASSRGLTGEVSHIWSSLTSTKGIVSDQPGRLVQLSNSRPSYWSQGLQIGEHHLLAGVGALGFATAHTLYTKETYNVNVQHAHSYAIETFADFGLIGVAVSLALLGAWALATRRTLGPIGLRAPPSPGHGAERDALMTLAVVVVTFGLHSLADWTWFIPGTAGAALLCAGWLAGRGPLDRPVGRLAERRPLSRSPGAAALVLAVATVSILGIWVIVQPLRAADSDAAAINQLLRGNAGAALTDARSAAASNPVSVEPLFLISEIYVGLGNASAARHELVKATSLQPQNPATWQRLGCYDLHRGRKHAASRELLRAWRLEPVVTALRTDQAAYCQALPG